MIWYVTGATGLVGKPLVSGLVRSGFQVVAISRSAQACFAAPSAGSIIACNLDLTAGNPWAVLPPPRDGAGLIALASYISPSTDFRDLRSQLELDTLGHLRLIDFLGAHLKQIVYASSCTVYGTPRSFPVPEEAPLAPGNVYALAKVATEQVLQQVQRDRRIPVAILRISQIYGPGAASESAMYKFLGAARNGTAPRITCHPETFRDYCHVDDVVRAVEAAIARRSSGVLNIGGGEPISIARLARACLAAAGSHLEPESGARQPATNMWLDISRARRTLQYSPGIKLENGVLSEFHRLWPERTAAASKGAQC